MPKDPDYLHTERMARNIFSLRILQPLMLSLQKITLTHYKNYEYQSFDFSSQVVGICGLNGKGKTNLLDAVFYCCFTKSNFSSTDSQQVHFQKEGFRLEAQLEKQGAAQKIVCIFRPAGKKEILLNDVPYDKYSKHIGLFPAVMIAPDDIDLITGASEGRRRFVDTVLSQLDAGYLQELIAYNKILQQRNSLLKNMEDGKTASLTVLDILDEQLITPGNRIHEKRNRFLQEMIPLVQTFYNQISGHRETVSLQYISQLNDQPFEVLLQHLRSRDLILQRSNAGIHKDDIGFLLNGQPFKQIASQGQRKSLLFALKLAEFELLKINKGFPPLLLLDDVFEKLDGQRMQQLLHWVCCENKSQVLITDTHRQRLEDALGSLEVKYQIIEL